MHRVLAVSTAASLAVAMLGACGSAAPAVTEPPPPGPAGQQPPEPLVVPGAYFRPGEQMTWELSLRGIFGGQAVLVVGDPGVVDGRNAIVIRSQTATAGAVELIKVVRDDVTTWVDLDSSLPIRLEADLQFGDRETRIETVFTPTGYQASYRRGDQPARPLRQVVPPGFTYDSHSLIGALRSWDPEPGTRAYFFVVAGRRLWHNSIRFIGREARRTCLGLSPTLRFEGIATRVNSRLLVEKAKQPRTYTVWFSDDARRVPLLLVASTEYGDVTVELTDYRGGPLLSAR